MLRASQGKQYDGRLVKAKERYDEKYMPAYTVDKTYFNTASLLKELEA